MTFADDMRAEAEALRRRHVHAMRPRGPMTLDEASDLCRRMAGDVEPGDFKREHLAGWPIEPARPNGRRPKSAHSNPRKENNRARSNR